MNFGAQVFIKGTTFDVVNSMTPVYLIEMLSVNGSGSKSYSVPPGKSLKSYPIPSHSSSQGGSVITVGNTVTWINVYNAPIFVYAE